MLQVNNLDKKLSGTENFHIDNVSLHIPGGYICGLIGENGAGKTTLIRILMGLYNTSGDVVINGHDMRTDEAAAKDDLAVVFDEGFFQQDMSLEQIGIFYGELYSRFDMSTYLEYLKRFELDKKKRYKKLSKGMKTKAQFAFALSHDAKLFLLDEPTAGLDRHFRDEFLKICADLVSDGSRSILISSNISIIIPITNAITNEITLLAKISFRNSFGILLSPFYKIVHEFSDIRCVYLQFPVNQKTFLIYYQSTCTVLTLFFVYNCIL